ncbi:MAG: DUF2085 domain-containing protein [Anaerolineae bacterium]
MAGVTVPRDVTSERITWTMARILRWLGQHWLLLSNAMLALYIGLPLLAPILAHAGYMRGANLIYLVYRPLCHQLPERSFFLFGPQWAYTLEELEALTGGAVPQRWIGNAEVGFKVAVCQRCVAIYGGMFALGILFAAVRQRLRPISIVTFGALCLPMFIDGLGQLFGLWASSVVSRLITGGLFALACILLVYPYLQEGMTEVRAEAEATIAQQSAIHGG